MSDQFQLGDVVKLKSGGLEMTVTKVTPVQIECQWMGDQGAPYKASFPPEALGKAGQAQRPRTRMPKVIKG